MHLQVSPEEAPQRLDLFLSRRCPDLSRSRLQMLIREGAVRVNGQPSRPSYQIRPADCIALELPAPTELSLDPEAIPLSILFEDGDLLVLDKGPGMTVHPAPGSWQGTLVNALLHHCRDLSGINGVLRPGIVHRLDRDTTGLLVVAKNDTAHRHLAAQLQSRVLERRYSALVWGRPRLPQGRIEAPVGRHPRDRKKMAVVPGGRAALTHYQVVERFAFLSLLDLRLETGRTHQIRVHLQHLGHPVFGDPVYGGRAPIRGLQPAQRLLAGELLKLIARQALHARSLRFAHPRSGEWLEFSAPLPADMEALLAAVRQQI
ncbi:MAG: RluA family pseudouridine synthase [Candidatus Latescibacteria bacterium]|nr:RluA family pseudouridine synthase [Candidatus Latescibacterota bacterium]